MADDSALSFAVGRLGQLLVDEVALQRGVHDEVEWMRDELELMKSFLEDAYAKRRRGDQGAKRWERAVRDVSYQAEEMIEYYMVKIIRRRQQSVRCCWILTCARELKSRHKLGVEIKNLKAKINRINEYITRHGLVRTAPNSATFTTLRKQRMTFPQHSDNVVVGFHDHKQKILQDLLNTRITRRCVKSIVGMGGLGKTTLAKMVFNSHEIKSYFDTRAWVCVSQNYTLVDLFTIIGKQVAGTEFQELDQSQKLDESVLKGWIFRYLLEKRIKERITCIRVISNLRPRSVQTKPGYRGTFMNQSEADTCPPFSQLRKHIQVTCSRPFCNQRLRLEIRKHNPGMCLGTYQHLPRGTPLLHRPTASLHLQEPAMCTHFSGPLFLHP